LMDGPKVSVELRAKNFSKPKSKRHKTLDLFLHTDCTQPSTTRNVGIHHPSTS
jgi:hypothetical protein